jgi:hypothetical protein
MLIDVERLKKEIEETVKKEVCLSQGELERIMMIIDEQPTVGFVITDKDMIEYLQSDPEKATKLNEEIRKWGARREV